MARLLRLGSFSIGFAAADREGGTGLLDGILLHYLLSDASKYATGNIYNPPSPPRAFKALGAYPSAQQRKWDHGIGFHGTRYSPRRSTPLLETAG